MGSLAGFVKDLRGNLYKVWDRMSSGSYIPPPVRLVEIPKVDVRIDRFALTSFVRPPLEAIMQKVFVAEHHAQAYLVHDLLRSNGIDAHVRGESLLNTIPGSSVIPGTAPEVWILNSDQADTALEHIRRFTSDEPLPNSSGPSWQCPNCSETLEPQFSECWKCGTAKPISSLAI